MVSIRRRPLRCTHTPDGKLCLPHVTDSGGGAGGAVPAIVSVVTVGEVMPQTGSREGAWPGRQDPHGGPDDYCRGARYPTFSCD